MARRLTEIPAAILLVVASITLLFFCFLGFRTYTTLNALVEQLNTTRSEISSASRNVQACGMYFMVRGWESAEWVSSERADELAKYYLTMIEENAPKMGELLAAFDEEVKTERKVGKRLQQILR